MLAQPTKHSFGVWTNTCSFSNLRSPSSVHVKVSKIRYITGVSLVCLVAQSSPTVPPMDCSLAGSSVHRGFSRQEYWSGFPCPSSGDLPNPGIKPRSPALQADSLPSSHQGSPKGCGLNQDLNPGSLIPEAKTHS